MLTLASGGSDAPVKGAGDEACRGPGVTFLSPPDMATINEDYMGRNGLPVHVKMDCVGDDAAQFGVWVHETNTDPSGALPLPVDEVSAVAIGTIWRLPVGLHGLTAVIYQLDGRRGRAFDVPVANATVFINVDTGEAWPAAHRRGTAPLLQEQVRSMQAIPSVELARPPYRRLGRVPVDSTKPRVLLLGSLDTGFDGMQQMLLWQARALRANGHDVQYLAPQCPDVRHLRESVVAQRLSEVGVRLAKACINCPTNLCRDGATTFFEHVAGFENVTKESDIEPEWWSVVAEATEPMRTADIVVQVFRHPSELFHLQLARIINPKAVRVLHLGSSFDVPAWPGLEQASDSSLAAVLRSRVETPAPYADVLLAPSWFVASAPAVKAAGIPVRALLTGIPVPPAAERASLAPDEVLLQQLLALPALASRRQALQAVVERKRAAGWDQSGLAGGVLGSHVVVVGIAGRLSPEKGHGAFLFAAGAVEERLDAARLGLRRRRGRQIGHEADAAAGVGVARDGVWMAPDAEAAAQLERVKDRLYDPEPIPTVVYAIIGTSAEAAFQEELRTHVQRSRLSERTVLTGFAAPERMRGLYRLLDVLVLPYSNSNGETYGLVGAEAMAAGLPVLHAGAGGMSDYCADVEASRAWLWRAAAAQALAAGWRAGIPGEAAITTDEGTEDTAPATTADGQRALFHIGMGLLVDRHTRQLARQRGVPVDASTPDPWEAGQIEAAAPHNVVVDRPSGTMVGDALYQLVMLGSRGRRAIGRAAAAFAERHLSDAVWQPALLQWYASLVAEAQRAA